MYMINQNFIDKYREFVNKLSPNYINVDPQSDESVMRIGNAFVNEVNASSKLQQYLLAKNIKFFNTNKKKNVKIELIPTVSMKQLVKKDAQIELVVWNYLQMFYIIIEVNNKNNNTKPFVNQLIKQLQDSIEAKPDEKNGGMNDMIFDIAETFKSITMESKQAQQAQSPTQATSDESTNAGLGNMFGGNTIENILKTSQVIAQKYQTKIESGDMSIDDMMKSLGKMLPGNTNGEEEGSELIDNIFSRQDVDKEKLEEMKDFYANENISINQEDIANVSQQLNGKIGEISSSMNECMGNSQDLSTLLNGITQLTNL